MVHAGIALIDPQKVFDKIALGPGMRVADFGCGRTGHFVFLASRAVGDTGIVYAVDVMKEVLETIKSRIRSEGFANVQAVWSNIELAGKTPIPEKSLDVCFFINVMFLLKSKTEAIREAARLLKDGGWLVVVDWSKKLGPLGPAAELMVKPEALAEAAKQCGLSSFENFSAGDYHFCLLLKKVS